MAAAKKPKAKLVRKKPADPLEKFEKLVVNVRLRDGAIRCVNCLRAARLVESGEAQPEGWSRDDMALVLEAAEAREQAQAQRLRADGLLAGEGREVETISTWSWLEMIPAKWR